MSSQLAAQQSNLGCNNIADWVLLQIQQLVAQPRA